MAELPTGTVTFLFTDIEGSTRLLQELGGRYPAVRDDHAAIIRQAIADAGGVEVSTEGDSFFAVFTTPAGAVRATVSAQRALAEHPWPPGASVRVRMGLHTGEGVTGGEDYVGIDVNRAARIADAAHGGQVLVSGATHGLVEHDLPEGASFRDLGKHRLRDIAHPEHLYDVVIEGLPADFLPPRTLDARPNNLPLQLTSFVGREREIAEVRRLLSRTRLLTLTGVGGTGKSRLALQVAAEVLPEYRDGVFFVDLSPVHDPALVPSAVATALGVPVSPGQPVLETVKDRLHDNQLLLLMDNFEQVVDASPIVEELLLAAPMLKVMVTSRVVLSLRGEQEYVVPPLEPPDPDRLPDLPALRQVEAVRLFTERARAATPRFGLTKENARAVAEIAARLDGLPLAIELAATRTKLLTPHEMLPRLEKRLALLTSGPRTLPERHRTLREAIAWSYDLLDPAERALFGRLSVFTGGWTIESTEAVCDPVGLGVDTLDGLTSLVNQSLVQRTDPDGEPRFSMLETVHEFAQERLQASGDFEPTRRRHAEHFLDLALKAEPHLTAEDQKQWLDRCELEHPNIRAALRWAIDEGDPPRAQEAAGALWRFWQQRGHLAEGRRWFDEVLAMPSGRTRTSTRAKALAGAGGIAWWQTDITAARSFYEEALAIERELGDPARIAEALYNMSFVAAVDPLGGPRTLDLLEEGLELFRRVGDEAGVARVLSMLAGRHAMAGDWNPFIAGTEEVVAIWRRVGDRFRLAMDLASLAMAYARVGREDEARNAVREALELFSEVDNPTGIGMVLLALSFLAHREGRHEDAVRLAAASESLRQRAGGGAPTDLLAILIGDPEAEARAHLSDDVARRAWEQGRTMSVDDATALALGRQTRADTDVTRR
jgi:predicted ATPase/class 3 adenylate cyclase